MNDYQNIIREIKTQYNIVDFFNRNNVSLKRTSADVSMGLCPFHNDKEPSLRVNEHYQNYKCFACGNSGDIISAAQALQNISFQEAVLQLAEHCGIKVKEISPEEEHRVKLKSTLMLLFKDAFIFYKKNFDKLDATHPAKLEISNRGLPLDICDFGYAPESAHELYTYLTTKGYTDEVIEASQLVILKDKEGKPRKPWDFFHGRLLFPIRDFSGNEISFNSRKIHETDRMPGKYVNGRDSLIFHKKQTLFNLNIARKSAVNEKKIYIVEGPFDVLALNSIGIYNVVASNGTAITIEAVNNLRQLVGADGQIIFMLDQDAAGLHATIRVFKTFPIIHMQTSVVSMPSGQDPCSIIQNGQVDIIESAIKKPVEIADFVIQQLAQEVKVNTVQERERFANVAIGYAVIIENKLLLNRVLSLISVISAIHIDEIRKIYDSKKSKDYKKTESISNETTVNLVSDCESDKYFMTLFAYLVRRPGLLFKYTNPNVNAKYKSFLLELQQHAKEYKAKSLPFRFIADEYSDPEFCEKLQNYTISEVILDDEQELVKQYKLLIELGKQSLKKEEATIKQAAALSSLLNVNDPKEMAKILEQYEAQKASS